MWLHTRPHHHHYFAKIFFRQRQRSKSCIFCLRNESRLRPSSIDSKKAFSAIRLMTMVDCAAVVFVKLETIFCGQKTFIAKLRTTRNARLNDGLAEKHKVATQKKSFQLFFERCWFAISVKSFSCFRRLVAERRSKKKTTRKPINKMWRDLQRRKKSPQSLIRRLDIHGSKTEREKQLKVANGTTNQQQNRWSSKISKNLQLTYFRSMFMRFLLMLACSAVCEYFWLFSLPRKAHTCLKESPMLTWTERPKRKSHESNMKTVSNYN